MNSSLDTETTGLDPDQGHRIVEIGVVELHRHLPTGRTYHQYINPRRDMPEGALAVHGLTTDFLSTKPAFEDIADAFLAFVKDGTLVIHNAAFDMKFLNAELQWCGRPPLPMSQALDTLTLARKKFPGSPASLDALCRRFNVDNTSRTLHGALLDAQILAEVYLELIGGRQPDLTLNGTEGPQNTNAPQTDWRPPPRPTPLPPRLTKAEKAAHDSLIDSLGENAIWRRA